MFKMKLKRVFVAETSSDTKIRTTKPTLNYNYYKKCSSSPCYPTHTRAVRPPSCRVWSLSAPQRTDSPQWCNDLSRVTSTRRQRRACFAKMVLSTLTNRGIDSRFFLNKSNLLNLFFLSLRETQERYVSPYSRAILGGISQPSQLP